MKIEQLLVQHFYKNREVTLQGIGTFSLSPDFVMPMENDKDASIPENAISFTYDSRAAEDDALINYIVEQTRKMKPLASADLDSYLVLGKQFLNIGKPFKIDGLGMLIKNQLGEYQFAQGTSFSSKPEEAPPSLVKEKMEENDFSFRDKRNKPAAGGKKGLMIAAVVVVAGLLGTAAWYFFMRGSKPATSAQTIQQDALAIPDTNKTVAAIPDSSQLKKDSVSTVTPAPPLPVTNDGYTFKVVFRVLSQAGALKKKIELNKPNVVMYTTDSVHYKLAEVFTRPLSDTTRVKDSLRLFYAFRTFIELK